MENKTLRRILEHKKINRRKEKLHNEHLHNL
jgi:hypothetical protein